MEHPRLTKTQIVFTKETVYCGDAYSFLFLLASATERKNSLDKGAELCIEFARRKVAVHIEETAKMIELISDAKKELGIQ